MFLGVDPQGEPPELYPVAGPLGVVGEYPDGETCARRQAFHSEFGDILSKSRGHLNTRGHIEQLKIVFGAEYTYRRRNRLKESNAKCRNLKKLICKGTLRQVFYLSETPSPPTTPIPPSFPLYTCIHYTFSHREGWEGGELTREKVRGVIVHSFTQPVENTIALVKTTLRVWSLCL